MKKIVLTYHRIGKINDDFNNTCVTEKNFEQQIKYLKNNFLIYETEELLNYKGNEVAIAISFDDGFESFYNKALPILEKYNVPATVFITYSGNTENEFWMTDIIRMIFNGNFDKGYYEFNFNGYSFNLDMHTINDRLLAYQFIRKIFIKSNVEQCNQILESMHLQSKIGWKARRNFRKLSKEQIKKLSKHRLITIGSHTSNHLSLGSQNKKGQYDEIINSKKKLEKIINKEIKLFSYPFGQTKNYNEITKTILKDEKYIAAFNTLEGIVDSTNNYYDIPRYNSINLDISEWKESFLSFIYNKEINTNSLFCGKRESDKRIFNAKKIVICGCGNSADSILQFLDSIGKYDYIVGFVDKDDKKKNMIKKGIRIYKYDDYYNDIDIDWVVQNQYDQEIISQLIERKAENIHWWI